MLRAGDRQKASGPDSEWKRATGCRRDSARARRATPPRNTAGNPRGFFPETKTQSPAPPPPEQSPPKYAAARLPGRSLTKPAWLVSLFRPDSPANSEGERGDRQAIKHRTLGKERASSRRAERVSRNS